MLFLGVSHSVGCFLLRKTGVEHGMGREPWYLGGIHRTQVGVACGAVMPFSGIWIKCPHSVCEPLKNLEEENPNQPTNQNKTTNPQCTLNLASIRFSSSTTWNRKIQSCENFSIIIMY